MARTPLSQKTVMFQLCSTLLALLFLATPIQAQITASPSTDPLQGSSTFDTPVFQPSVTFTGTSTFPSATGAVLTSIVGIGPNNPDPSPYTYAYSIPTETISGTDLAGIYSSIAAEGSPTAATSPLAPNAGESLQIVANQAAPGLVGLGKGSTAAMVVGSIGALCGVMAVLI